MTFPPWRRPRICVIELRGIIASRPGSLSLRAVAPAIDRAFAATRKGGSLILDIESPGGSPVQSDLLAARIRKMAQARDVRVHAVIGEVGASGGYWLACAADEIHANPMSIVGSIGVIGGGFGFVDALRRYGVERRLYTAGENKARLDPFSPERPQDVEFAKRLLDDLHTRFKAWVRERRGSRLHANDSEVFDGGYMLGSDAQAAGLIDGIGDVDSLVETLGGERARARVYRPRRRRGLLARLPGIVAGGVIDEIEERQRLVRF